MVFLIDQDLDADQDPAFAIHRQKLVVIFSELVISIGCLS